jgi:hypothetical protein
MISLDASGDIRISRETVRNAGFRPGNRVAVTRSGENTFTISSASRVSKNTESARYTVEKDGRIRVNRNTVQSLGVRSRRKTLSCQTASRSITVSM